jgi:hypothetical protein
MNNKRKMKKKKRKENGSQVSTPNSLALKAHTVPLLHTLHTPPS